MTSPASARLQAPEPLRLAPHVWRNAVPRRTSPGERALVRRLDQGKPIAGRVVFRRRERTGRHNRRQVHSLSRRSLDLRRIDQPIPADPEGVRRFRKVGYHVPPAIVCDDDLHELGRQAGRFRNHPDARFRSFRAGNHAADVIAVDAYGFAGGLTGKGPAR